MAHGLCEAFWVARIVQGGAECGTPVQRGALFCRFEPPGARGVAVPAADNLLPFCWPLGVESVKPSPYLVTCEFSFTLTGGDGQRLHGFCRKTHDPTHQPGTAVSAAGSSSNTAGGFGRGSISAAENKRFPQVLCILSQYCWPAFFSKVLEVVDQLLSTHASCTQLPPDAPAALFMASLPRLIAAAGPAQPPLGAVLRVPLPYSGAPISVDRMRRALAGPGKADLLLSLSPDMIELEVPPSLGNCTANAGVSLARLLWFLTPRQAVTLVASLLLERRVILVARDAETVSAAVHAANAMLYPFRWQHIYLPLLPLALKDYLAAPMPYLAGVQAECLPLLRGLSLEEVVMIDLDHLGSCTPELGSPEDDYWVLPYARELEDVFEVVREHIKSPTEFDSTPKCTELLQDFFLRLVGKYRQFVRPDEEVTPAALALGLDRPAASGRSSNSSSRGMTDENPRAHGFLFDQAAFIIAHRRKDKVAAFLQQFRNSQMLEVFITERLKLASEGYVTEDPFELKVTERNARKSLRLSLGSGNSVGNGAQKGRISHLLRKAGSVVKQGGGSLVASIQRLGNSQQEETQMGRGHNSAGLSRMSPGPNGVSRSSPGPNSLSRPSPGIPAAAVVAHSRNNSFSGSRPGSRSSSHNNLHRASANLAALNGGVQPSLEQLRPDMFFGADDDEDDSSSVASEASLDHTQAARPAAQSSPGPLEKAMGASRSFGSIFPGSPPVQYATSSRSSLPHQQLHSERNGWQSPPQHGLPRSPGRHANGSGPAAGAGPAAAAATNIRFGFHNNNPVNGFITSSRSPGVDASSAGKRTSVSASPASLSDLHSPLEAPRWQQRQELPNEQLARPQQLFPEAIPAQGIAPYQRSPSAGSQGWATFSDDPSPLGAPFAQQPSGSGRSGSLMDASVGPLGMAMSSSMLKPVSSGFSTNDAANGCVQQMSPPHHQQQQEEQRMAQHQQQQQQIIARQQQQQKEQPQSQPKPIAPQPMLDGVSAGWGPVFSHAGGTQQEGSASPLPSACRHTAHSPLAQGMQTVQRFASFNGGCATISGAPPRRGSSGGTSVVGDIGLHVKHDAFADVAVAAAVEASEHMPSHRHTSSTGSLGGNPFRDYEKLGTQPVPRQATAGKGSLSSTSSFGDWSSAWPGPNDGPLGAGRPTSAGSQPPVAELAAVALSTHVHH